MTQDAIARVRRFHDGEENAGFKQCQWPRPSLPFWALLSDGMDHDHWTREQDGRRCPAYQPKGYQP